MPSAIKSACIVIGFRSLRQPRHHAGAAQAVLNLRAVVRRDFHDVTARPVYLQALSALAGSGHELQRVRSASSFAEKLSKAKKAMRQAMRSNSLSRGIHCRMRAGRELVTCICAGLSDASCHYHRSVCIGRQHGDTGAARGPEARSTARQAGSDREQARRRHGHRRHGGRQVGAGRIHAAHGNAHAHGDQCRDLQEPALRPGDRAPSPGDGRRVHRSC